MIGDDCNNIMCAKRVVLIVIKKKKKNNDEINYFNTTIGCLPWVTVVDEIREFYKRASEREKRKSHFAVIALWALQIIIVLKRITTPIDYTICYSRYSSNNNNIIIATQWSIRGPFACFTRGVNVMIERTICDFHYFMIYYHTTLIHI